MPYPFKAFDFFDELVDCVDEDVAFYAPDFVDEHTDFIGQAIEANHEFTFAYRSLGFTTGLPSNLRHLVMLLGFRVMPACLSRTRLLFQMIGMSSVLVFSR